TTRARPATWPTRWPTTCAARAWPTSASWTAPGPPGSKAEAQPRAAPARPAAPGGAHEPPGTCLPRAEAPGRQSGKPAKAGCQAAAQALRARFSGLSGSACRGLQPAAAQAGLQPRGAPMSRLALLVRVALAALFAYAALTKLPNLAAFAEEVANY